MSRRRAAALACGTQRPLFTAPPSRGLLLPLPSSQSLQTSKRTQRQGTPHQAGHGFVGLGDYRVQRDVVEVCGRQGAGGSHTPGDVWAGQLQPLSAQPLVQHIQHLAAARLAESAQAAMPHQGGLLAVLQLAQHTSKSMHNSSSSSWYCASHGPSGKLTGAKRLLHFHCRLLHSNHAIANHSAQQHGVPAGESGELESGL